MSNEKYIPMTPTMGSRKIEIPVTFDYSGGRRQKLKSRGLVAVGVALATIVIVIITLFASISLITKPIVVLVELYLGLLIIRFPIMEEHKYRKEHQKRIARDYVVPMSDLWTIYNITGNLVHYRNGYKGVFVMFEKKAIVGQNEEDRYNHYESIASAYNVAGSKNISLTHVDYMAGIGEDNRLRKAIINLNSYKNGKIKNILNSIFSKVQKDAERTYTEYDIYLFLSRGSIEDFQRSIQDIVGCINRGNYAKYSYLNKNAIQVFAKTLFNLHDFSVNEATRLAFPQKDTYKLTTIRKFYYDGTDEKVGKTSAELKEERALRLEQTKADKREIARKQQERERNERERKLAQKKKQRVKGIDLSEGIEEYDDTEPELEIDLDDGIPEVKKNTPVNQEETIDLD